MLSLVLVAHELYAHFELPDIILAASSRLIVAQFFEHSPQLFLLSNTAFSVRKKAFYCGMVWNIQTSFPVTGSDSAVTAPGTAVRPKVASMYLLLIYAKPHKEAVVMYYFVREVETRLLLECNIYDAKYIYFYK